MKLLIITLLAFMGLSLAFDSPSKTVISPDFLFNHTAEYHVLAEELQDDINQSVQEVITTVSNVLKRTTRETLTSIEEHYDAVDQIYKPIFDDFNQIRDQGCRATAQSILDSITNFSGFEASNCIAKYDAQVKAAVEKANNAITSFDGKFGQVQLIVTRNFIRQNAFLAPEDIKTRITAVYEDVRAKWLAAKPELQGIRDKLSSDIGEQNKKLDECHVETQEITASQKPFFQRSVQTCLEYENIEAPFSAAKSVIIMKDLYEELQASLAQAKPYEWL